MKYNAKDKNYELYWDGNLLAMYNVDLDTYASFCLVKTKYNLKFYMNSVNSHEKLYVTSYLGSDMSITLPISIPISFDCPKTVATFGSDQWQGIVDHILICTYEMTQKQVIDFYIGSYSAFYSDLIPETVSHLNLSLKGSDH